MTFAAVKRLYSRLKPNAGKALARQEGHRDVFMMAAGWPFQEGRYLRLPESLSVHQGQVTTVAAIKLCLNM